MADPSADGSFRYEMFARRLQAAIEGREDAVAWAWDWYQDLMGQDLEALQGRKEIAQQRMDIAAAVRADIAQGHSDNPRFQAFLDTLEDPEGELYREDGTFEGWKFLVWIGPAIGAIERTAGFPKGKAEQARFVDEKLLELARSSRAQRLGGPAGPRVS